MSMQAATEVPKEANKNPVPSKGFLINRNFRLLAIGQAISNMGDFVYSTTLLIWVYVDEGARRLGEFAFGNNPRVDRCSKYTLFDEKMGGTVHLALGASIPETGGLNQSALHWDMVCDLRSGSEIRVDGELFSKNGKFAI
jgi:leucyl aminopeptidase (aminopeptidase T)